MYEELLKGKYPAKTHAKKVGDYLKSNGGKDGIIYLEGQKTQMIEDKDQEVPFHQRRFFFYITGCPLPDCSATYNTATDALTLFIPAVDPDEVIWSGLPETYDQALSRYDIDECLPNTDVIKYFERESTPKDCIYTIPAQVSPNVRFDVFKDVQEDVLKKAIENCRVVKSPYEIALISEANRISNEAHLAAMRAAPTAKGEADLEAVFHSTCTRIGCRNQAYSSIVASGPAAATLHYIRNDADLKDKQMVLLDAGCEKMCYASDVTRTFPVSGTFAKEARSIYELVLRMQTECMEMMKEGVKWEDVHLHAHRVGIEGLLDLGILKGGSVDELLENRTSTAFLPHGLGHYLGMDTHDTGGNANYADPDPMFRYLRVRGTLPANSVITVEPGIYFCRYIIEPFLKDEKHKRYIDEAVLERYWDVGGVRIEDDVVVTEEGVVNLTITPSGVAEVEAIVQGKDGGKK